MKKWMITGGTSISGNLHFYPHFQILNPCHRQVAPLLAVGFQRDSIRLEGSPGGTTGTGGRAYNLERNMKFHLYCAGMYWTFKLVLFPCLPFCILLLRKKFVGIAFAVYNMSSSMFSLVNSLNQNTYQQSCVSLLCWGRCHRFKYRDSHQTFCFAKVTSAAAAQQLPAICLAQRDGHHRTTAR